MQKEINSKTTPGPWQIGLDSEGMSVDGKIGKEWYPICDLVIPMKKSLGYDKACEVQEANARLIAAAPTMLKLLEDMTEWDGILPHSMTRIKSVISKAQGGAA